MSSSEVLLLILLMVFLVPLVAVIGGTIIYFLWPIAVPAALPGLVAAGTIASKLTWGQAIALSWLAACLFPHKVIKSKE